MVFTHGAAWKTWLVNKDNMGNFHHQNYIKDMCIFLLE
jgi:hypothetical protein